MNDLDPPMQSLRSLILATVVAGIVAGIMLILFVLPAEYGLDPTGIGKKIGLTALAATPKTQAVAVALPVQQASEIACTAPGDTDGTGTNQAANSNWQDSVKITVPANEGLEYKFHLDKGAPLEYSWSTDGTKLYFDFHGEPAGDTTGYFKSFKESTDRQSSGSLTAPFEGSHGWYWENKGRTPVTIVLNTRGRYRVLGLMQ